MRYKVRERIQDLFPTFIEAVQFIENTKWEDNNFIFDDLTIGLESIKQTFTESFTEMTNKRYQNIINDLENNLHIIKLKKQNDEKLSKEVRTLLKQFRQLDKDLANEPEVKLEILFIPYKYSMWDSLESIWIAASEDPRCKAHVMPIPYYDRDENGLLADFHHEIDAFLENGIPAVHYEDYDYTVVQPDIIYFHNPYDGNNRVTSVAPEFYTNNLKNYTDMLVYVPYFVAGYYDNLDRARGFVNNSGVKNADKVILQSNALKNVYLDYNVDEKKLMVLGSPKIDAVLNLDNKVNIPDEWTKLENSKVIFLNSSIRNFLEDDSYLDKLEENILAILDEYKMSLIWRPHPLFESTIRSMKVNKLDQYEEIIKLVSSYDNAVVDRTDSFYNAMYYSDALITDASSITQLYITTKKPVLMKYRNSTIENERYLSSDYFSVYFESDISVDDYLNMLLKDKDPKRDIRFNRLVDSLENSDGTAGLRINEAIVSKF